MSVENDDTWDSYKYTVKSHGERIERLERLHSASKDKLDLLMARLEISQKIHAFWGILLTILLVMTLWRTF
jgi:hypothetical protein